MKKNHHVTQPIEKQRDDQYGGSLENRIRLVVEIIEAIKTNSNIGVMVQIPGQDLYPRRHGRSVPVAD
ncbi:oxidoreductase [Vibrio harveyi]|uniref:oxidoreductase n=1 Tax=Vibrio harveyi TaxID=669 RepID=UPI000A951C91|nr:hypothetical protein [Vibrio harveyi]